MSSQERFLLYVAVVMSFTAAVISVGKFSVGNLDSAAFIVGALALIVTALIGWQIYTLVDLRNYREKFADLEKKFEESDNTIRGFAALSYAYNNLYLLTPSKKEDWFNRYVQYSLLALVNFSQARDYQKCWAIINELMTNIDGADPEYYKTAKAKKTEWLITISDVKEPYQISNYKDLINYLTTI